MNTSRPNTTNLQSFVNNSLAIRQEIQRFESVHPSIYAIYDLIELIPDIQIAQQIRDHVVCIEDHAVVSKLPIHLDCSHHATLRIQLMFIIIIKTGNKKKYKMVRILAFSVLFVLLSTAVTIKEEEKYMFESPCLRNGERCHSDLDCRSYFCEQICITPIADPYDMPPGWCSRI